MHRSNNAVIMQTEQLGRIEALEEELRSSRGKVADMEQKMMEQDQVIAQLEIGRASCRERVFALV